MSKNTIRQQQALASRQKLLEAAARQFEEYGYKGTTVRMINQSVDLADGLLYHYFPGGKKEIFQEVVKSKVEQMVTDLYEKVQTEDYFALPLKEALEYAYVNFCMEIDRHIGIIRLLLKEKEVMDVISREEAERLFRNREPWLMELLRRKAAMGEIREMDIEIAAISTNAVLISQVLIKMLGFGKGPLEDEEYRRRMIDYQICIWSK